MVRATFTGTGTKKILLLAHMDTVYPRGMLAKQPFRIKGDRAYGVGIADDKQGIAVIIHAIAMLKAMNFRDYGTLTVLINADEEISSPGSRSLITRLGAEHDAVLSFEASRAESDKLALATAGIASVTLNVQGRASHAGSAPERGINALYELSHQILQMRDLSDPATGVKMNWTVASAGRVRNMIPPNAQGIADVRVLRVADYDGIERKVRERVKNQLLPEAKVELIFERRRPPLEATDASRALGKHAQQIYGELGKTLVVDPRRGRRRHRRRLRVAEDQGAGDRALRAAGLWRAHHRGRIRADRIDRAAALSDDAHDHGRVAGQGAGRAVGRAAAWSILPTPDVSMWDAQTWAIAWRVRAGRVDTPHRRLHRACVSWNRTGIDNEPQRRPYFDHAHRKPSSTSFSACAAAREGFRRCVRPRRPDQ